MQVVCLNDRLKDGETVLDIGEVVVSVDVDTMDLDLVTRASDINKIMKHEYFFLAGHTTGWHRAWCLLNGELLIVPVERPHLVDLVRTALMTHNTLGQTRLCLLRVCVADGSLEIATLASEVHLIVLWEDLRALSDDSAELNQGVQVNLAQLTHLVLDWQLIDPHIDLLELVSVVGEDLLNNLTGNSVQDGDHVHWLLCKPNCKVWLLGGQIGKVDLEGLLVHAAHVLDAVLVSVNTLDLEAPQEAAEGLLDVLDDFLLLEPKVQVFLRLAVVIDVCHVIKLALVASFLRATHHAGLSSPCILLISREFFIVNEGGGSASLATLTHHFVLVELALGGPPLVHVHGLVVVLIHACMLVVVELRLLPIVTENEPKIKLRSANCALVMPPAS